MHHLKYILGLLGVLLLLSVLSYLVFRHVPGMRDVGSQPAQVDSTQTDPTIAPPPTTNTSALSTELCEHFYHSVCKRREITVDPTGTVQPDIKGEVEALRLYERIIHEHRGWSNEQVDEELVKRIYTEKRRKALMELFEWITSRIILLIEQQPLTLISESSKKELVARLKQNQLELPPPASLYASEPDLFTKNDVYFESLSDGRKVIRVGGAYLLAAKSRFNRVFTVAHEIGHSIDPCELASSHLSIKGYDNLLGCFMESKYIKKPGQAENCGHENPEGEAFADWIAAQITALALQEYEPSFKNQDEILNSTINAVRDLCTQETWLAADTDSHPDPSVRIGSIFGKHPTVQRLLGCSNLIWKPNYCTFEGKQ